MRTLEQDALRIEGVFVFAGNSTFNICKLDTLLEWAAGAARAVLIAADASARRSGCW